MGTHPIFESDFDCLTELVRKSPKEANAATEFGQIVSKFFDDYAKSTPVKLKAVDAYLGYTFFTGVIQFVYCCLVGTFPFNAFLSGFISCVTSFVLGVSLRLQLNPENKDQFQWSDERAFGDFLFAHFVLHLVVMNFIG